MTELTLIDDVKVKFSSLPAKYQTEQYRKFYDKDGNGWLNTRNKYGQNEISLMESALGISLSQYYTKYKMSCETNKDGNGYSASHECSSGPSGRAVHHDLIFGAQEVSTDTLFNNKGKVVYTHYNYRDKDYPQNSFGHSNLYEEKVCTKGRYNLVKQAEYQYYPKMTHYAHDDYVANGKMPINVDEFHKRGVKIETYLLNGKSVNAKSIGNGRYEITDSEGNVFYISHDGKKLNPEFVREELKKQNKSFWQKFF